MVYVDCREDNGNYDDLEVNGSSQGLPFQVPASFIPWPFNYFPYFLRCRINYFRVHLCYILISGFIGGCVIYGIEKERYSFGDCLFTGYSSCTVTGLALLDNSKLTIVTQVRQPIALSSSSFKS